MAMVAMAGVAFFQRAPFDNEGCYHISSSPESIRRRQLPQRQHMEFEGGDLWCGVAATIPSDVTPGSLYALYWVWDWPTEVTLPGLPKGKIEVYITCLDVLIKQ